MKDLVINKESERQVRDAFLKALPTQTDGITAVCVAQLTDLHPTAGLSTSCMTSWRAFSERRPSPGR
jgi:hypothetical protein